MTTLDALDLAAASLRECQAIKSDPDYKRVLGAAHDRIQHLREIELRHGTLIVADQSNARIVPRDTIDTREVPVPEREAHKHAPVLASMSQVSEQSPIAHRPSPI